MFIVRHYPAVQIVKEGAGEKEEKSERRKKSTREGKTMLLKRVQ